MGKFHFPDMEELFIGIMMLFIAAACLLVIAPILQIDIFLLIAVSIFYFVMFIIVLFMVCLGIILIKESIYW